ncbi:MAG TPA: NAD(P)-dependent oxidoreductase [Symbiobacteriaceae bacterium]|nr:NAD(P)-dependent oxidoreductase [Symbiobacteriaceae bacterium]
MAELGFIGLGRMGRHMVRNLLKAGNTVTVFNRSQGVVDELVAEGARRASDPAETARNSRVLFTCLTTPDVVESTLRAALEGARPGDIFVDHSTIGVADAKRIAAMCAERGVKFIDAPVSGGPWGAEAGTLTIMCGGDRDAYEAVLPYLQAEGKSLYLLGPVGAGTVAKLCNNMLVGIHAAAMAEAFVLGTKAGVDPKVLFEIIQGATGQSRQIERNIPKFVFPGNFEAAFSVSHLHKDLGLAVQLGRDEQVRLLLGGMTQQIYEETRAAGYTDQDMAAVIRPLEDLSGVKVRA